MNVVDIDQIWKSKRPSCERVKVDSHTNIFVPSDPVIRKNRLLKLEKEDKRAKNFNIVLGC